MPYASLHEAFTPYSEHLSEASETSNPDLINNNIKNKFRNRNDVSEYYENDHKYDTRDFAVEATQQDPIAAFYGLSSAQSLQVPGNTSIAQNPDDIRTSVKTYTGPDKQTFSEEQHNYSEGRNYREINRDIERNKNKARDNYVSKHNSDIGLGTERFAPTKFQCGSDKECLDLINHLLSCDNCTAKLKKILQVENTPNVFGFELNQKNLSKLMFYIIVALLVIAVYELLNNLFRKLLH